MPELPVVDLGVEGELAHEPPDLDGVGPGDGDEDDGDQDAPGKEEGGEHQVEGEERPADLEGDVDCNWKKRTGQKLGNASK